MCVVVITGHWREERKLSGLGNGPAICGGTTDIGSARHGVSAPAEVLQSIAFARQDRAFQIFYGQRIAPIVVKDRCPFFSHTHAP